MISARFQTFREFLIVSCDVGRPGGYLFSFLFFLFSGFRRRRFDSFIPELPMNPCRRIKPLEETIDQKKDLYFFQEKDLYFLIKKPLFFKGT